MSTSPVQPKSILRGHKAQVHAAAFVRGNERLATGDAEGYVVLWDLTIRRPRAVWQPHTNAILGIAGWGRDKIITHGRDHRLVVWKLDQHDEATLKSTLPLEDVFLDLPQPWIVHIIEVNTMNFCSFGFCTHTPGDVTSATPQEELLLAVPNTLTSEAIDIFHLPSQQRRHTVRFVDGIEKDGMVMALSLNQAHGRLTIIAGFENGLAVVTQLNNLGSWTVLYRARIHSQPILSLDVNPNLEFFLTSSADGLVAKHPIPNDQPISQESEDIMAALPQPSTSLQPNEENTTVAWGVRSDDIASERSGARQTEGLETAVQTQPLKIINTRHSGQQGLRVRSDGKIFATAGWDSRVRIYSSRTMRELAVLKWHQVGCYAVAFSEIGDISETQPQPLPTPVPGEATETGQNSALQRRGAGVVPKLVETSVKNRRISQANTAHWLAAGGKDGKVSLWDVY